MLHERTFRAILAKIATSGNTAQSLRELKICNDAFYGLLDRSPAHAERYARAKQAGLEALADETLAITDEEPQRITRFDKDGEAIGSGYDPAAVQWQKQRVETRKWLLAKLAPKKYGERTVLAGDPDAPLVTSDDSRATILGRLERLRSETPADDGVGGLTH